jgi:hypothetical protein
VKLIMLFINSQNKVLHINSRPDGKVSKTGSVIIFTFLAK